MGDTSRQASPSRGSSAASARPRASSLAQPTERLTLVHPIELTPIEAGDLKEQEADRLAAAGDLDGALVVLQKAIFFRPDHAALYAKLARVYWDLCDLKSAMASYRKLLAIDENPPQRIKDQLASLLDLYAFSLLQLGEPPPVAIAYLTEAIQLNSLEETFWLHRALAHIRGDCLDKALKDVDHCVNLNNRDVEYFVLRAKLHWRLHMHEKATQDIHRAAALQPDHPEVVAHELRLRNESQTIYALACRHLLAREFADAVKCLTSAAEISPTETKVYLLRASAHRELGDLQTAMTDIDKALSCHRQRLDAEAKKKMRSRRILNDLADQSKSSRLLAPVTTTATSAAVTEEDDRTREYRDIARQRNLILNELALRFLRDKSFQVALNAMNQVIQSEAELAARFHEPRTNTQHYVHRGDAYRGLGNLHAALADYHHALELGPENQGVRSRVALVHYQFGIDLFNQAQFQKAELEFAKAIAEDESVATYHVRKGDAARYQEKHHVACQDYHNAVKLNPNDADTSNKLLQYAVDPPSSEFGPGSANPRGSTNNQLAANRGASAGNRMLPSPQRSPFQERAASQASTVDLALKSYQRKNKRVQDLFLNRPTLPSPTAKRPPI